MWLEEIFRKSCLHMSRIPGQNSGATPLDDMPHAAKGRKVARLSLGTRDKAWLFREIWRDTIHVDSC